jgi:cytochrome c biogenesis protein
VKRTGAKQKQPGRGNALSAMWRGVNGAACALYSLLHSMSFAIFLLIAVAIACAAGMIVPQQSLPESYLRAYGPRWGGLVLRLGLEDVFHATWFYALFLLLSASLVVCSIHRLKLMRRSSYEPGAGRAREQIRAMRAHASWAWPASAGHAARSAEQALRGEGYRVLVSGDNPSAFSILARKGTIGNWGTLLIHSSLLVIFAGALYGHLPEIRVAGKVLLKARAVDSTVQVLEGEGFQPPDADFEVRLRRLRIPVDDMGRPMQYYSDLEILEGGKIVARPTIWVNRPYERDGYSLYQSQWSLEAFILRVTDRSGRSEDFQIPVREDGYNPMDGLLLLHLRPWWVFVHAFFPDAVIREGRAEPRSEFPANPAARVFVACPARDPRSAEGGKPPFRFAENDVGWITERKVGHFRGLSFRIARTIESSGILVRKDPGLPIVWTGFGMILVGIFLAFYTTPRTIRLFAEQKGSRVEVELGIDGGARMERELEKLRQAMQQGGSRVPPG